MHVNRFYLYCKHISPKGLVAEEEEELSKTAMAYITNFARTGYSISFTLCFFFPLSRCVGQSFTVVFCSQAIRAFYCECLLLAML